jgi:dolichyl-phosphate beta-glucosyltransferase
MLEASRNWALLTDADNSTTIDHLDRFASFAPHHDVIIASRRLPGSRIIRPQPRIRQKLGQIYPYLVHHLALPGISDSQAGFKLFRRHAAHAIFSRLRTERFAFDARPFSSPACSTTASPKSPLIGTIQPTPPSESTPIASA